MPDLYKQETITEWVRDTDSENLTFEKAIELFENIYMASRNLSPRTRVEYKTDVEQLVDFLHSHGTTKPADIGLSDLQSFLANLDRKGFTGISRRRKVASIRAMFGFLKSSNLIPNNPTQQLIPPEREYKEPRYLTKREYEAVLQACSQEPRDLAIIQLLLQTGVRLSEIARLTTHDIELPRYITRDPSNTGTLVIHGKGKKERTLPLNYKACQALKDWLAIRPEIVTLALFITMFREPMGPRTFEELVAKYMKQAGIEGATVHSLRHTFGVHHAMRGTELKVVQTALGHSDPKTTSIYFSMAKEAMNRQLQDHAL